MSDKKKGKRQKKYEARSHKKKEGLDNKVDVWIYKVQATEY